MESAATGVDPQPPIVFRGKKRKTYRQRTDADDEESRGQNTVRSPVPGLPQSEPVQDDDATNKGLSVAEVLRQRNARKSRLRGVTFGADNDSRAGENFGGDNDELSLMIREEENRALDIAAGVNKRFAPQTGLVGELVNKHIEQYIEAELAKKHSATSSAQAATQGQSSSRPDAAAVTNQVTSGKNPEKHIALQGKLMEIDLGDEVRSRNEAMTDRARRKLQGETVEDEEQAERPKKVRLGRDGKPWRPRNRRDSDAIKRDQLVEEILRENRLDVYDTPTPPPAGPSGADEEDGAADDRIAEEFRREFMEAMAQRQKKKRPAAAAAAKPGAKKDEEVLKGPKLGGSRNSRAAMRDLLLKKEKEGKR